MPLSRSAAAAAAGKPEAIGYQDMEKPEEMITDGELVAAAGNANFGSRPLREVIDAAVLQTAAGFSTGHTVRCMMEDLGLVSKPLPTRPRSPSPPLRKKGKRYLWACYGGQSF